MEDREKELSGLERLADRAEQLEVETHALREETSSKMRRASNEFRILFGLVAVLLALSLTMSIIQYNASQDNREILKRVQSVTDPEGELNIRNQERTAALIQRIIDNQDENAERVLERLEELD